MRKTVRYGKVISYTIVIVFFLALKALSVIWICKEHKSLDSEKNDIIERKNYLVDKLVTSPQNVLNEMPSAIGAQFQGEWALYSCSMLSAAYVNLSNLYPETKEENISYIDSPGYVGKFILLLLRILRFMASQRFVSNSSYL